MKKPSQDKQHGFCQIRKRRPKSPQYKRNNKAKANERRAAALKSGARVE